MFSENLEKRYEVSYLNKKNPTVGNELKLLISFNKIEFSTITKGYYKLARNIFISALPFLLYVKKVTTRPVNLDFEAAKGKAMEVLQCEMQQKKMSLMSDNYMLEYSLADSFEVVKAKIDLLDQAISILGKL